MAIRNATVQKSAPQARNGYQIDKVATVRRADNDNRQSAANDNRPTLPRRRLIRPVGKRAAPTLVGATEQVVSTLTGVAIFWRVVAMTWYPYPIQVAFGVICLLGLGIAGGLDDSIVDWITFGTAVEMGGALLLVGLVGTLIFGALLAAGEAIALSIEGVNPLRGMSWLILAICTLLHLCPIINIFPIMWLWCLYVSLAK